MASRCKRTGFLVVTALLLASCSDNCGTPPEPVEDPPGIERIHFSTYHLCTLDEARKVWCAGGNASGQLGDGSTRERSGLVRAAGLEEMTGIAVGLFDTSCAWNDEGELYCWGNNDRHVLATDEFTNSARPVPIEDLPPIENVTLGAYHACALTKEAEVYCWGDNREGQAGLGDRVNQATTPTKVVELTDVKKVVAGAEHTCAITTGGILYCWGKNDHGQLGQGSDSLVRATSPQVVGLVPGPAVDLDLSFNHSCATFGERRRLYCWGNNDYGQLGVDDLESRNAPTEIPEIAYVDHLAAGGGQVCARVDEKVYCAGEVLRPVEVARQTGEGYLFRPSPALEDATELWSGVLAICGPLQNHSVACRGIEHRSLTGELF